MAEIKTKYGFFIRYAVIIVAHISGGIYHNQQERNPKIFETTAYHNCNMYHAGRDIRLGPNCKVNNELVINPKAKYIWHINIKKKKEC